MVSQDYIDKDVAHVRKPVEIFKFWVHSASQYWYYTSGDVEFDYDGDTYTPALMKRSRVSSKVQMHVSKCNIKVERLNTAFITYLTQPAPEPIWIEISKLFRDQSPAEKRVVFIGQVLKSGYNGVDGFINCVGFEKFLRMKVPVMRYQPSCNLTLFSSQCGVTAATYLEQPTIDSISANGLEITDTTFASQEDGYYVGGYVEWGNFKRMIVAHVLSVITIQFSIPGLIAAEQIDVYPGCNKSMAHCKDKFSNLGGSLDRFFGFRYIPRDNPATWQG